MAAQDGYSDVQASYFFYTLIKWMFSNTEFVIEAHGGALSTSVCAQWGTGFLYSLVNRKFSKKTEGREKGQVQPCNVLES